MNRIQDIAQRQPGPLMMGGYTNFQEQLHPAIHLQPGERLPMVPCAVEYVSRIAAALSNVVQRGMSVWDRRE